MIRVVRKIVITDEVKSAVEEFVHEQDRATIPLIRTFLRESGLMETDGKFGLALGPSHQDVLLWSGMSMEFVTLLQQLREEGRIHVWQSTPWENRRQGGMQRLPAINFIPSAPIGGPRWYPICYRTVPMPED